MKDGGPAFPTRAPMVFVSAPTEVDARGLRKVIDNATEDFHGLTLRDYFAGQALAGLHASPNRKAAYIHPDDAEFCYNAADAMLAARGGESDG